MGSLPMSDLFGPDVARTDDARSEAGSHRRRLGQYLTPAWAAEALVERHFADLGARDVVLEPSCGDGRFLEAIPGSIPAYGVEIDPVLAARARSRTGREVLVGDFRTVPLDLYPTAIIGNPPFDLDVIDGFLSRAYQLLPPNGRVGFILPAYAFQTAARVAGYAESWSLFQEMIPRNIFPDLSKPLVFAVFSKDRRRTLVGFALYREAADVQQLPEEVRAILAGERGPIWCTLVAHAMRRLGGRATLEELYRAIEGTRPTGTRFWREKVRQTLQRYRDRFLRVDAGVWALSA